ncbi:MAG TPA: oligoendopeptidase F [Spirochaetota bacterium]|nr:oligoendopeptidase F [Spirochaetota bacterium]
MQKNAKQIPARNEIPAEHTWDLMPLFVSDSNWEEVYSNTEQLIPRYKNYEGKLADSFDVFLQAIEFDLSIARDIDRLYTYAHLRSDEDTTNQNAQAMLQKAHSLAQRAAEASSFLVPEIQSLPEAVISNYLTNTNISQYLFYIEKILRYREHTLSKEIEEILAMAHEVVIAPMEFFRKLDNADMRFGTITNEQGNTVELSHGNFITFLMSYNQDVRKNAFHTYYKAYDNHKYSIAQSLASSVKKDVFFSRVRKFKSCLHQALFPDNIPDTVYHTLIETVSSNLQPLFKYLSYRKEALGLTELHFYDTYVPLVADVPFSMEYEEACDVCAQALHLLGEEYISTLHTGLLGGWVDRYENRGKVSGAYSSGCYDSPPYILLNYDANTINSLYTLIHEAGHSMHSYYSRKNQPYVYHEYTIFVAEVASTLNEILLSHYLLQQYSDNPRMQAYILNREIDEIRGTLFRQTMFAEFELLVHTMAENNKPLTFQTMTDTYTNLLHKYFGTTIVIDTDLYLEYLRIPHFYSAFYVYKYATGIAAALSLAKQIINNPDTSQRYLQFLSLGGSTFPLEELRIAGVDMESPEPVIDALQYFDSLVDRFIDVHKKIH